LVYAVKADKNKGIQKGLKRGEAEGKTEGVAFARERHKLQKGADPRREEGGGKGQRMPEKKEKGKVKGGSAWEKGIMNLCSTKLKVVRAKWSRLFREEDERKTEGSLKKDRPRSPIYSAS